MKPREAIVALSLLTAGCGVPGEGSEDDSSGEALELEAGVTVGFLERGEDEDCGDYGDRVLSVLHRVTGESWTEMAAQAATRDCELGCEEYARAWGDEMRDALSWIGVYTGSSVHIPGQTESAAYRECMEEGLKRELPQPDGQVYEIPSR